MGFEKPEDVSMIFCHSGDQLMYMCIRNIEDAMKRNIKETAVKFGSDEHIPNTHVDEFYHYARVIYFINHPDEISDISIRSKYEIKNNIMTIYPSITIRDGRHRLLAALYRSDKTIQDVKIYDYLNTNMKHYLTGESDILISETISTVLE
jgi:hypothetical protein